LASLPFFHSETFTKEKLSHVRNCLSVTQSIVSNCPVTDILWIGNIMWSIVSQTVENKKGETTQIFAQQTLIFEAELGKIVDESNIWFCAFWELIYIIWCADGIENSEVISVHFNYYAIIVSELFNE
jgi:hypothetical protein